MHKKILILILVGGIVFSAYGGALAEELGQIGNTSLRISATYALDESNKNSSLNRLEPSNLTQNKETDTLNTNVNTEFNKKNFSLTDLISTLKKVFFGIISALGID